MRDVRLGEYRESMATNPLLRKAPLGKSKERGFDLPDDGFIYGRPNHCIDGGAQEAMQYCVLEEQRERADNANKASNQPKVNFLKLNKDCVQKGLVNAKEQAMVNAKGDKLYAIKPPAQIKFKDYLSAPKDVTVENTNGTGRSFGISTRPSTPVFELLEHRYQKNWLEIQKRKQRQQEECAKKKHNKNGKIRGTQATYQYQKMMTNKKESDAADKGQYQKLWQMGKFSKKPASLETFRSDAVREASMKKHNEQRVTRRGIFGHGIFIEG